MNEISKTVDQIVDFARQLLSIPSPSGYTRDAIDFVEAEATRLGYASERTKKGNLIVTVPGRTDAVLGLSGHVDTLGAMVRSIAADGTLRFTPIGGPQWPTLDGEYCTVRTRDGRLVTGTFLSLSPSSHVYKDANTVERTPDRMMIRLDALVTSKQDVLDLGIGVGDFVFIDPKTVYTDAGFLKSRFLDDKASVAILFGFLRHLREYDITPRQTLKIVVSTYEEVGHGAAWIPPVDEFIAVDMGCIGEDLSCTERMVSVCCKDSSGPYDYQITSRLIELAKQNGLSFAADIYPMYGSDVSAALRGGQDVKGGLVGPGVHASHGMERTHRDALENTLRLLLLYTE
ncbi:MAG: M42 family metallopeptidase [Candidatus Izemoplasmatales bacterium]